MKDIVSVCFVNDALHVGEGVRREAGQNDETKQQNRLDEVVGSSRTLQDTVIGKRMYSHGEQETKR